MKYKNYIAHIEFDEENKVFSGNVINTRAVITFHGESVTELEKEFANSVEEYLAWCKEDGVEPERPYSGRFNVRFSPELHRDSAAGAAMLGLSLNGFIEKSVRDELLSLGNAELFTIETGLS